MAITFLNDDSPLEFVAGDTALGVGINEAAWDLTGGAAVVHVESLYDDLAGVVPFDGEAATVQQASGPCQLRYAWPSGLNVGCYRVYFTATFSDGGTLSTNSVLVNVDPA